MSIDSHVTWVPEAHANSIIPWMIDGRPWNGYDGAEGTPLAGTARVYRWPKSVWSTSG